MKVVTIFAYFIFFIRCASPCQQIVHFFPTRHWWQSLISLFVRSQIIVLLALQPEKKLSTSATNGFVLVSVTHQNQLLFGIDSATIDSKSMFSGMWKTNQWESTRPCTEAIIYQLKYQDVKGIMNIIIA